MRARTLSIFAGLAATALLAAPAFAQMTNAPRTVALKGAGGADLGTAVVTMGPSGVLIHIDAKGLTPGWHGVHLHEKGDCSAADFTSAGAHMNSMPTKKPHGLLNVDGGPDFGDLPNLYVAADGTAHAEAFTQLTRFADLTDADGSAIVIHASADDHRTQPIGGAGARVGCGVIK